MRFDERAESSHDRDEGGRLPTTEYHVVHVERPDPRWEVRWGKRRLGYKAWDQRVAVSAATEMAKSNRPSKIIIHDRRTGEAQSELRFDAAEAKQGG